MSSSPLFVGSRDALAEIVTQRQDLLIMTDYDGTLVPIRERPDLAVPGPELLQAVKRLRRTDKVAFAVISGRSLEDLEKMIPVSGIYLIGCHGAQFRTPNGERFAKTDPDRLHPIMDRLAEIASGCTGGKKGFLVEHKGISLAFHYRQAEARGQVEATGQAQTAAVREVLEVLARFLKKAAPLMAGAGLEAMAGKKVVEIHPRNINKGEAVKYLMNRYPKHYPLYFGDDTTDEDAFTAVAERGTGVLVSGRTVPERYSAASLTLPGPADVIKFLENLTAGS